jgi:hypothetical protein
MPALMYDAAVLPEPCRVEVRRRARVIDTSVGASPGSFPVPLVGTGIVRQSPLLIAPLMMAANPITARIGG